MVETYGMQPGFSMGNASAEVQATYNASNCNSLVCEDWKLKYGVIPWKTYGRLPAHLIASWDYARPLDNRRSCNSLSGASTVVVEICGDSPAITTPWLLSSVPRACMLQADHVNALQCNRS